MVTKCVYRFRQSALWPVPGDTRCVDGWCVHGIAKSVRPDERNYRSSSRRDFPDCESQPSAHKVGIALFLAESFVIGEDKAKKAHMNIHENCF